MEQAQLGLRFAASALFFVMLVNLARDPESARPASILRRWAWGCVAFATVFGFSPINVAREFGHTTQWESAIRLGALFLTVSAALLWSAARGFAQGGNTRQVIKGGAMNILLVCLCLTVAAYLR